MIYDRVELHNVAEAHPAATGGVRLQRVPEAVRARINETAQMRMLQPDNCEIRFVCENGPAQITLSSEGETDLALFQGTFDARARYRIGRKPLTITIEPSPNPTQVKRAFLDAQPFRPNVMRLIAGGRRRDPLILHDVSRRSIRPPTPGEIPGLRYLAYGTSITQGFDCEAAHLSYVGQTAWGLRADVLNMGVGGSCFCEAALADYFASRTDWHLATLELSLNMGGFSIAQFSERVRHMVNTVAGSDPSRLVACITLLPHGQDMGTQWKGAQAHSEDYRQALRDAVRDCPHANVHLIEGPELLRRLDGLGVDLVHPSDHAMIEIGKNLVERLEALLQRGRPVGSTPCDYSAPPW